MVAISFRMGDGSSKEVEASDGSLMELAVRENIDGIDGECGGCLSCATCHVYVEAVVPDALAPPSDDEDAMLEAVSGERRDNSRLSCQILLADVRTDLVVMIPQ